MGGIPCSVFLYLFILYRMFTQDIMFSWRQLLAANNLSHPENTSYGSLAARILESFFNCILTCFISSGNEVSTTDDLFTIKEEPSTRFFLFARQALSEFIAWKYFIT